MTDNMKSKYALLPKVELHVHLEGSIPLDALWVLVDKYGGDPIVTSLDKLKEFFIFRNFQHFIETWIWKNGFLREYEDFTFIAEKVARDLADQNIRYAEVFFSPPDFHRHGLETQRLTEAIRSGFSIVDEIEISLISDVVRDFGPEKAIQTLEEINEVKEQGVIGIGLGGSENLFPPGLFTNIFERARGLDLYTSVHAGEASGSDSIWEALHYLRPDRIGHGTRAFEDEDLLDYLCKHKIPIEMCPLSNVMTGITPSIKEHPIRDYYDMGLTVTVNTDDPKMFGTSLEKEFLSLVRNLGFSFEDVKSLIMQGIKSSWLNKRRKENLIFSFQNDKAWSS